MPESSALQAERLVTLKAFPIFADVPARALAVYAKYSEPCLIAAGEYVYREGSPLNDVFIVVDGEVSIYRENILMRTMGNQSSVGFMAMVSQNPKGITAIAKRSTYGFRIPREVTLEVLEDNFENLYQALTNLAREVINLRKQMPGGGVTSKPNDEPVKVENLDIVERCLHIRKFMRIAGGRIEAVFSLARESEVVRKKEGETLWAIDEIPGSFLIILQGQIDCTDIDGQRLFSFFAGDVLGGLNLMARAPHWFATVVAEDIIALSLTREQLSDAMEDNIDIGTELLKVYARALDEGFFQLAKNKQSAVSKQSVPRAS